MSSSSAVKNSVAQKKNAIVVAAIIAINNDDDERESMIGGKESATVKRMWTSMAIRCFPASLAAARLGLGPGGKIGATVSFHNDVAGLDNAQTPVHMDLLGPDGRRFVRSTYELTMARSVEDTGTCVRDIGCGVAITAAPDGAYTSERGLSVLSLKAATEHEYTKVPERLMPEIQLLMRCSGAISCDVVLVRNDDPTRMRVITVDRCDKYISALERAAKEYVRSVIEAIATGSCNRHPTITPGLLPIPVQQHTADIDLTTQAFET